MDLRGLEDLHSLEDIHFREQTRPQDGEEVLSFWSKIVQGGGRRSVITTKRNDYGYFTTIEERIWSLIIYNVRYS